MELGPSTIVGLGLSIVGLLLYLIRTNKPDVSRDYDLFFSSVGLLCGGILIFQGWRLDPILLLCQILSSGTALFFIGESLWLRNANDKNTDLFYNIGQPKQTSGNDSMRTEQAISLPTTSFAITQYKFYQEKKLLLPTILQTSWKNLNYTLPIDYSEY